MFKKNLEFLYRVLRKSLWILSVIILQGCFVKGNIKVALNPSLAKKPLNITISNIQVVNHQIVITGTNLSAVSNFDIKESSNQNTLQIETKTNTQLIANTIDHINFSAGKIFSFILSNAQAASAFTINFSLCDSTLGGKGFNCSITPNDKEVLSYDAVSGKWKPRALNGFSYQGSWDARTSLPSTTTAGDFFIVNYASGSYNIGDWIVFNGSSFDQIANSNALINVFGRTGAITANKGDYNLNKLADVDLSSVPPVANQYLKFNGTNWIPGSISTTEFDPTVQSFAKIPLPNCSAGQVLKSSSTTFSCIADNVGGSTFTGTPNRTIVTDGAGALTVSTITDTVLGYLAGTTSNIQTQISNKADMTNITQTITALSITGLQNPVAGSDAANKTYVDSKATQWTKVGTDLNYGPGNVNVAGSLTLGNNQGLYWMDDKFSYIRGDGTDPGSIVIGTHDSDHIMIDSAGYLGINTMTPSTTLDVNGAITMRKAYFESVGNLGAPICGSTNITGFTTNIYSLTACASGTTTINIPTVAGWPAGNMSWNVTFYVTGQTASVFNVSYNGTLSSVYWDKNSTGSGGGNNYTGFSIPSGSTDIIACTVLNVGGVKVYCGVAAQY